MKVDQIEGKSRRPRRSFTRAFKQDLVNQTLASGASISAVALANGLNTNQLFTWRRQLLAPTSVQPAVLLPVEMEAAAPLMINIPADPAPTKPTRVGPHIEIAGTHATVRLHGHVDQATLRNVLHWLAR